MLNLYGNRTYNTTMRRTWDSSYSVRAETTLYLRRYISIDREFLELISAEYSWLIVANYAQIRGVYDRQHTFIQQCFMNGFYTSTQSNLPMSGSRVAPSWWGGAVTASWTQTFDGHTGSLSRTHTVSGGTYRVRAVYTAYSGSTSESITGYSSEVRY